MTPHEAITSIELQYLFKMVSRIVAPLGDLEETLTEIEGSELQSIVAKFNDVFMVDPSELGCTDVV